MKLFMLVQSRDISLKLFALVLLALGLAWFVNRRLSNEGLDAVHAAFIDCAGGGADIDRVKECISAQLGPLGTYRYSVDHSSHTLSIRNVNMATKFPGMLSDSSVTCSLLPNPLCIP